MKNVLKAWEKEKKLIPIMIKKYCQGNHKIARAEQGIKRDGICADCHELTEYALMRLDKCPFKRNKQFCSFCKIHCYNQEMRERIKNVMKYSGKHILLSHPIFAISHVSQMIKYRRKKTKIDSE